MRNPVGIAVLLTLAALVARSNGDEPNDHRPSTGGRSNGSPYRRSSLSPVGRGGSHRRKCVHRSKFLTLIDGSERLGAASESGGLHGLH